MTKNNSTVYEYRLLTPVHVGSGNKLSVIDMVCEAKQCTVIDMDALFERLKHNTSAFNEMSARGFNISDFLGRQRIKPQDVCRYTINNPESVRLRERTEILEMMKTGMGAPIIPGSSIKGALRTAILHRLWEEMDDRETSAVIRQVMNSRNKKERAAEKLNEFVFGKTPNEDFMRALQVGDAQFNTSEMVLTDSVILNAVQIGGHMWKKWGKSNTADPRQAMHVYCEALRTDANAYGKINIDESLIKNEPAAAALGFADKKDVFDDLSSLCNSFALNHIQEERVFFEQCGMNSMAQFYTNLQKKISNNGAFLLQLGWGTGWRSMTGNFLDRDTLNNLRENFHFGLAKCPQCNGFLKPDRRNRGESFCGRCRCNYPTRDLIYPNFPKTRKLILQRGKPSCPFGWIEIRKTNKVTVPMTVVEVKKEKIEKTAPEPPPKPPKPPEPPRSEFMRKFEEFALRPSPDKFGLFIKEIKTEEIAELKEVSFKKAANINIGFAPVLIEADIEPEMKKLLAEKLLEVIKIGKKWKGRKLENYRKLKELLR